MQIGKTSSLVLTLSGVLKNIMIVFASMLLFHDAVSGLQFFGFAVALGGLVYYQLGGAPAFRGYWRHYRSQKQRSVIVPLEERGPSALESQELLNDIEEPNVKAEIKHG